eukprot:UN21378
MHLICSPTPSSKNITTQIAPPPLKKISTSIMAKKHFHLVFTHKFNFGNFIFSKI